MNGGRITEFDDKEDHEIEKYYPIQLYEVTFPKQGARWGPDYRMSLTKGQREPENYSQNVVCIERQVITIPATKPILTLGELRTFQQEYTEAAPHKLLIKVS